MSEKKELHQKLKKESFQVRITTFLKSTAKDELLQDCINRGETEADVSRDIIKLHYEILSSLPHLRGKDFKEIKEIIVGRNKY